MSALEILFPTRISFGATGGPGFNTAITRTDSGREERVDRWGQSQRNWNVAIGLKNLDYATQLIDFHLVTKGSAHSFRFKDYSDFSSAANKRNTPAFTDQAIGIGDGVTTQFQLKKTYTFTPHTVIRSIIKPVAGTVVIGIAGVQQTGNWSVNTVTGIVTFNTAPGVGLAITAGFYFDCQARFGEEVDKQLPLNLAAFEAGRIDPIPVIELKDEVTADEDFWFGGATNFGTMTANVSVTELDGRVLTFNPTTAGRSVILPNPATLEPGGPKFYIVNQNNTNTLAIVDHLAATVATLSPLSMAAVVLAIDLAGAKKWLAALC